MPVKLRMRMLRPRNRHRSRNRSACNPQLSANHQSSISDRHGADRRMLSARRRLLLQTRADHRFRGSTTARGRFVLPEEDSTPGGHAVAVMNFATWQARFGAGSDIVGKTLRLNRVEFTVIGVAPRNVIGVNAIFGPDLWLPATMAAVAAQRDERRLERAPQSGFPGRRPIEALSQS